MLTAVFEALVLTAVWVLDQEATPRACLCWEAQPALNFRAMKPRCIPASSLSCFRYYVSPQLEYTHY
jgi:hypothetical protein